MRIDRKYKGISKVASTDGSRYVLNGLHIMRTGEEKGYIEATDGRRLVRVPTKFDKQELFPAVGKDCIIPTALFLQAVKEPCHTHVYDLGWTRYLPVSRMAPDDLVS